MNVGIRALKEHLSEYLERAARGELILVTDRGAPKAMLGPAPGRFNLAVGIAEKWVRAGDQQPPQPARRSRSKLSIQRALRDDRGD